MWWGKNSEGRKAQSGSLTYLQIEKGLDRYRNMKQVSFCRDHLPANSSAEGAGRAKTPAKPLAKPLESGILSPDAERMRFVVQCHRLNSTPLNITPLHITPLKSTLLPWASLLLGCCLLATLWSLPLLLSHSTQRPCAPVNREWSWSADLLTVQPSIV